MIDFNSSVAKTAFAAMKDAAVRDILSRELAKRRGNRRATARELGIDRGYLLWLIRRYNLKGL